MLPIAVPKRESRSLALGSAATSLWESQMGRRRLNAREGRLPEARRCGRKKLSRQSGWNVHTRRLKVALAPTDPQKIELNRIGFGEDALLETGSSRLEQGEEGGGSRATRCGCLGGMLFRTAPQHRPNAPGQSCCEARPRLRSLKEEGAVGEGRTSQCRQGWWSRAGVLQSAAVRTEMRRRRAGKKAGDWVLIRRWRSRWLESTNGCHSG